MKSIEELRDAFDDRVSTAKAAATRHGRPGWAAPTGLQQFMEEAYCPELDKARERTLTSGAGGGTLVLVVGTSPQPLLLSIGRHRPDQGSARPPGAGGRPAAAEAIPPRPAPGRYLARRRA
ncbi:MAG: hypothetical protein FJ125_04485 [Deltaproteobacteria bacterium]|nr:hypothetical protein [Deltaproteobacteria bacterium]